MEQINEAATTVPFGRGAGVNSPRETDVPAESSTNEALAGGEECSCCLNPDAKVEEDQGTVTSERELGEEVLEAVRSSDAAAVSALGELRDEISRFHERASAYERNARVMHSQIESLQQDQVRVLLKPVFERLAGMHAQANEIAAQKREADAQTAGDFAFFAEEIEELFSLYSLQSVDAKVGAPFEARQHAATRATKTDRRELDGALSRVLRQGFTFEGSERVFMPARVTVFSCDEPIAPVENPERTTSDTTDEHEL